MDRQENEVQRNGEMVIEQEQKPENILESRDALETQGAEKDEL